MRIVTIEENTVTLELETDDFFLLGQGLYAAGFSERHERPANDVPGLLRGEAWMAAAEMLEGAGMAAAAWMNLVGTLDPDYALATMRADVGNVED